MPLSGRVPKGYFACDRAPRCQGWENHMLILDNYNSGPGAPYKLWVLLEKEATTD